MSFDFHAAYDELNADDHDYRFYGAVAGQLQAGRVLDLGCGTGTLARLLARHGREVVGIDPDPDMLRVARGKPGSNDVDWRLGYCDSADPGWADLAVMSGHVAQVFVSEEAWGDVLQQLHRALRDGGILAFESRNPSAQSWERWTRAATLRTVPSADGEVEFWHETVDVSLPQVTYDTFTRNLTSGDESRSRNVLAFRDHEAIDRTLRRAGFEIGSVFGDWDESILTNQSPEIIVLAQRR